MISFILPTRKRLPYAIRTLTSTFNSCSDPSNLEILLGIDEDDTESLQLIPFLKGYDVSYKILVTKRYGYHNLHLYVNDLCKLASKDYVWLWNDDIYIKQDNWDKTIESHLVSSLEVYEFQYRGTGQLFFPLVPKKITDWLGHFSLNAHNDSWMYDIVREIIPIKTIPINIINNRDTNSLNIDYSEVDNSYKISSPQYFTMVKERELDRKRLRELVCK